MIIIGYIILSFELNLVPTILLLMMSIQMRCCGATDFNDYAKLGMVVPTTCYAIDTNYVNSPVS